jgi:polysaccharide deacetylase family protein (PEP-CTERM system associated)
VPDRGERRPHSGAVRRARAQGHLLRAGLDGRALPADAPKIAAAGHEIASHGYEHVRITQQTPKTFREDLRRTSALLEDVTGNAVRGYRAASFSICRDTLWAFDELLDAGYVYSSSIYPVQHDLYGMPEAPRFAFRHLGEDGILEIPVTTVEIGKRKLPCGGGGYFRLFPYALSRWAIRRVNRREGQPAVFYFHPWEIDPEQPRQKGIGLKTRVRHYLNLSRMERRLSRLCQDFSWGRMDEVFLNGRGAKP